MKLDRELVRQILEQVEEKSNGGRPVDLVIPGSTAAVVSYHVKKLDQAGLLEARDASNTERESSWQAISLTWKGHEFLEETAKEKRGSKSNPAKELPPSYPSPDTYERDDWILQQRKAHKTWPSIMKELTSIASIKKWEALYSENACRSALKRIAAHLGIEVPKVKAGRPRKTPQTPQ